MIVRDKQALLNGPRDASGPGWTSLRLLVRSDGMGFSMTETQVLPGAVLSLQYKNHVEACYCVAGEGEVIEKPSGKVHPIAPGILYAPNDHGAHEVRVPPGGAPLRLICVFSPALEGDEVHDADGSYPAPE